MLKKATSGALVMLLLFGLFGICLRPEAKAQTANPSQVVVAVSGVPAGTKSLAVEVTVDTAVIKLGSPTNDLGALSLADGGSKGVAILSETDLPSSFSLTVALTAVAVGTSMFALGNVLDMLGGTAIAGAMASVDKDSVVVSAGTTTSTSSTTGGAGGMLSADAITITITGQPVTQTDALVATVGFGTADVAKLATAKPSFMATGASQLLTDVDPATGDVSAAWTGTITDEVVVLTQMIEAGSMAGTTSVSVSKVRAKGGEDITSSVVAAVSPSSVTNSAAVGAGGVSFSLIGPDEVTGPGKAAVAFSISGGSVMSATLNGAKVDLSNSGVGIAIVKLPESGSLDLDLTADGTTVELGTVSVDAGEGKAPKVNSAVAQNKSSGTKLTVTGKKFSKEDTTVAIVPTDREALKVNVKGAAIKAAYSSSECIPKGSYVNVSTGGGTGAKKIKVRGSCANSLVE